MKKSLLFIFSVIISSSFVFSQDLSLNVMASQGSVDSTSDIILEWTLGEIFIKTVVAKDNIYSQGFHQPVLNVAKSSILTNPLVSQDNIIIYPNPSDALLNMEFKISYGSTIQLDLFDVFGRFIKESKLKMTGTKLIFNISDLANGIYLLRVSNTDGSLVETHRIIKS